MNRTLGRILLCLAALLVAGTLAARPAAAQIIITAPEIYTWEGILGYVGENQITVVDESNVVVPILLPTEFRLPPEYHVGQRVWVELEKLQNYDMWRLRRIRPLDSSPSAEP